MRAVHRPQLLQLADRRAAGAEEAAAGALAPAPTMQRLKATCPSAQGRPVPAASAPAWPAESARGLHFPSISFSFAQTLVRRAIVCSSCSAPG